jgi:ATP-dependent RNA helicase DeaD
MYPQTYSHSWLKVRLGLLKIISRNLMTEKSEDNTAKKSIPTVVVFDDTNTVEAPETKTKVQIEVAAPAKTLSEEILASANATVAAEEEAEARQEKVEAAKSVKPVKPVKPVAPVKPIKAVKAVKSVKPVKVVKPVEESAEVVADTTAKEKLAAETVKAAADRDANKTRFRDLDLSEPVQKAVAKSGYEFPTAIQEQIIPHMLDGRDVMAQSQTGSGKTAAFALPILSKIDTSTKVPHVLVLAPTRELAIQVAESFDTYASQVPRFSSVAIYGGQDYEVQFRKLRRGVQVVVGTPGRVIDHIKRGTLDLSKLNTLVLDEADEMLNMGFLDDVEFVLDKTPKSRQVTLFSATFNNDIKKIAKRYLNDPVQIKIQRNTITADSIRQRAILTPNRDKIDLLIQMLEVEETDGVLIFTRTKDSTISVAEHLNRAGLKVAALNGDMPQKTRERTIERLKAGRLDIVVATDVAARGLDVTRVSHVFNYDLPEGTESYIHRVGRTGRAGRKGEAIIFLTHSQRGKLRMIERATKKTIEIVDPPSAKHLNAMRVTKLRNTISETIKNSDLKRFQKLITEHAEETGESMEDVAAALAFMGQRGNEFFSTDKPKRQRRERDDRDGGFEGRGGRESRGRRAPGAPESGMTRYRIEVGRRDGVKPGNIVGAIANEAGIEGKSIGPIQIYGGHSTIDLPSGMPDDVREILTNTRVVGRELKIREATPKDEIQEDRGSRGRGYGGGGRGRNDRRGGGGRDSRGGNPRGGGRSGGKDFRGKKKSGGGGRTFAKVKGKRKSD